MFFYNSPFGVLEIQLKNHQIYSLSKAIISKKSKKKDPCYNTFPLLKKLAIKENIYNNKKAIQSKKQQAEISVNQDDIVQKTVSFLDNYFLNFKKNQLIDKKLIGKKKQFKSVLSLKQIKFGPEEQNFFLTKKNFDKEDIILFHRGTEFQRKVWRQLITIPYGQTWTYGEVAKAIGFPKAVRAVGSACAHNPYLILVPCHRVVSKKGLGGFALGLTAKKKLLKIEDVVHKSW